MLASTEYFISPWQILDSIDQRVTGVNLTVFFDAAFSSVKLKVIALQALTIFACIALILQSDEHRFITPE